MTKQVTFPKPDSYFGVVAMNTFRGFRVRTLKQSSSSPTAEIDRRFSWEEKTPDRDMGEVLDRFGQTIYDVGTMQAILQFIPHELQYPLPVLFESGDLLGESDPADKDPVLGGLREPAMIDIISRKVTALAGEHKHVGEVRPGAALMMALNGDGSSFPFNLIGLPYEHKSHFILNDKIDAAIEKSKGDNRELPTVENFDFLLDQGLNEDGTCTIHVYADPSDIDFLSRMGVFAHERALAKGIDSSKIIIAPSIEITERDYMEYLRQIMAQDIEGNTQLIDAANQDSDAFLERVLSMLVPA